MGLPQVSSGSIVEEIATSLNIFAPNPPRMLGISSCDLNGMHGGNTSECLPMDLPCSSFSRFQEKWITDLAKDSDLSNAHREGKSSMHMLNINSAKHHCWSTMKSGQNTHTSVPLSVCDATEASRSIARKRLLSPLNGVLLNGQFDGDLIDIAGGVYRSGSSGGNGSNYKVSKVPQSKKAHIDDPNYLGIPIRSSSCYLTWHNSLYGNCLLDSISFTDGPLLENTKLQPTNHFVSSSGPPDETIKEWSPTKPIAIPLKDDISPSRLSPLGPKFPERPESAVTFTDFMANPNDDTITLKDIEQSLEGTVPGSLSLFSGGSSMMESHTLKNKSDLYTSESNACMTKHWSQHLTLTNNKGSKACRTLSGLPVQKSLVGSFEESLLSGRLFSTKLNKVSTLSS